MSTQPQTEEYLAARRESCKLLGLNADDLTPHEMIRADLATVLRLWLDGSQSTLLAGGNADPVKLLSVVEALTKLVPETEHKSRGEDPRAAMWAVYSEMRRRGALHGEGYDGKVCRIAELEAKIAELEAALGGENSAPAPVDGRNPPAADNVVPMPRTPSAPSKPAPPAPAAVDLRASRHTGAGGSAGFRVGPPNEAWRNFVKVDWQG
jgi:hypothetical protein